MAGYTKLFNSILASTIWREDDKTRLVWITLLAMADKNGLCEGSVPGVADFARVSVEDCRSALQKLQEPDRDSRTPDFDGRRIETVDGGWRILNHAKYRAKMSADDRRAYNAGKQKEYRQQKRSTRSTHVNDSQSQSTLSTHSEADSESKADAKASPKRESKPRSARPTLPQVVEFCGSLKLPVGDAEATFYKWEGNGWTNGGKPIKDWQMTIRAWVANGYMPSQKNGKSAGKPAPGDSGGLILDWGKETERRSQP